MTGGSWVPEAVSPVFSGVSDAVFEVPAALLSSLPGDPAVEAFLALCRQGGTTAEAIKTFQQQGLMPLTAHAMQAAVARAGEMETLF